MMTTVPRMATTTAKAALYQMKEDRQDVPYGPRWPRPRQLIMLATRGPGGSGGGLLVFGRDPPSRDKAPAAGSTELDRDERELRRDAAGVGSRMPSGPRLRVLCSSASFSFFSASTFARCHLIIHLCSCARASAWGPMVGAPGSG